MHLILHNWPDSACLAVLRHITAAMIPGYSKLLVSDMILPDKDYSEHSARFDWLMVIMLAAMERTEMQWRKLLDEDGLEVTGLWYPLGKARDGIIECMLKG